MAISARVAIVVPVVERGDHLLDLHSVYSEAIGRITDRYEFVYVLAPYYERLAKRLEQVAQEDERVSVVLLNKNFGEATALQVGASRSTAPYILTLPAYEQIEPGEIVKLFDAADDQDVVMARRWPRVDSAFNRLQASIFHTLLNRLSNSPLSDAGCGVRLIKREVFDEIDIYGDMHRFIPLLAQQAGFRVATVDCRQSTAEPRRRVYPLRTYLSRILDLLTIIFLAKFNKKPLRFFGVLGSLSAAAGIVGLIYLTYERIFLDVAMADRPALVLFSLLIVLGVQLVAIGLVGETFIFTNAKHLKEYKIKSVVSGTGKNYSDKT